MIAMCQFAPGEIIINEGETGKSAFVIERGKVAVLKGNNGQTIQLTTLGPGASIGEMSMIDDKPRSATVKALEETVVREIHRDNFFSSLQEHPEVAVNLLRSLFERLREANMTILQLQSDQQPKEQGPSPETAHSVKKKLVLEGLTDEAIFSLPQNPMEINNFPFRIGRDVDDPLIHNDLSIPDAPPLQISRHHISFIQSGEKIGVFDRGSHLGFSVDGKRFGGKHHKPGPLYLEGDEKTFVLGTEKSHFRYLLRVLPSNG